MFGQSRNVTGFTEQFWKQKFYLVNLILSCLLGVAYQQDFYSFVSILGCEIIKCALFYLTTWIFQDLKCTANTFLLASPQPLNNSYLLHGYVEIIPSYDDVLSG